MVKNDTESALFNQKQLRDKKLFYEDSRFGMEHANLRRRA
tara:strand:- start:121 stop:240 length:120 start_codon:yes stop_codon:yes gene_type:complete